MVMKAVRAFFGGTSRMSREAQVRICEGLRVKFPGSTRCRGAKGVGHRRWTRANRFAGGSPIVQRKAAAFARWHEPDDARVSSPDL